MVPLAASACRTRTAAVTPATLPLVSAFLAEIRVVHMGVGTAGALRPEEGMEVVQVLAATACRTRNAAVNLAT